MMFQGGPFRSASIREVCVVCKEPAVARCERCGAPMCEEHMPAPDRRCLDCELIYEARVQRPLVFLLPLGVWLAAMLVIATGVGSVFVRQDAPFNAWMSLALMTIFLAPFAVIVFRVGYVVIARQRFLAQKSAARCQPVSYSEESWFE